MTSICDTNDDSLHSSFVHVFDIVDKLQLVDPNVECEYKVDHFKDVNYLCQGTHSEIFTGYENYHCRDKTPPCIYALKFLSSHSIDNGIARNDFDNEINILSRLRHPNIVEFKGFGLVPIDNKDETSTESLVRKPMIVLEYLSGKTLTYHLKRKRSFHTPPFTTTRYIRIARELASALSYLHEKVHNECTLIHRDIKPDNIAFTATGVLKLIDFGLCISVRRSTAVSGSFDLTGCTGSFRYMAPENALNKCYNEKVDIYSYGLVLYEIVTGVTPYTGFSKEQLYARVIHGTLRPDMRYDEYGREVRLPVVLRSIIHQCWQSEPGLRPSAGAILQAVTKLECERNEAQNRKGLVFALLRSLERLKLKEVA